MEFIAALNYEHHDTQGVSHFLCDHLGFSMIYHDSTSVTVNNGVLSIRFRKSENTTSPINLDMETQDLAVSTEILTSLGFKAVSEVDRSEVFRHEQLFEGPFGLKVNLHRILTEDDLGIPADLDKTLDWEPKAEELAKELLAHVTIHFRNSARSKMVKQAEALALIEGNLAVSFDDMVTAFLYTTPYFKQDDLQRLLIQNGVSREFIDTQIENM